MIAQTKAELLKLRSTRTTIGIVLGMIALIILFSLLSGLLVLSCFPADGGYLGIAELARMLDMNTSTTHRYVTTLLAVGLLERSEERELPRHLLFLDADLAGSAAHAAPLVQPVRDGQADMTIAVFSERVRAGGHGFVVALSGSGIRRATGWRPAQPLNGQRCLTRAAFEAARPLAPGWGVETGMTIDLLRLDLRVTEVEVPMAHRVTGGDWHAQLHRARQFAGVAWALAAREPAVQTRVQTARHALRRSRG